MSDAFKARLAGLAGSAPRYEQSAARVRVREAFDTIKATKARGITWQAIADLMNADGLRATDGSELTAGHVASLYTAEKNARGGRRRRRTKKPAAQSQAAPQPTREPIDPPDQPQLQTVARAAASSRFKFSGPVTLTKAPPDSK